VGMDPPRGGANWGRGQPRKPLGCKMVRTITLRK
jgi:hypothetical protein